MSPTRVHRVLCGIAFVFIGTTASPVLAQCEQSKFTPVGAQGEHIGLSLSSSGNLLAVGSTTGEGAAYVLARSGDSWVQEARLFPLDHHSGMYYGVRVSLSGDRLIVGAMGDDHAGPWSGSAYIFRRGGGGWVQEAKLISPNPVTNGFFGQSVSLASDVAVVGESSSGKIHVYRRSGTTWPLEASLTVGGAASLTAAATDGASIIASQETGATGIVRFFRRVGSAWVDEGSLPCPEVEEHLAITGNRAVAGVPTFYNDDTSYVEGKVRIFARIGSTWSQQADLQPSQNVRESYFGGSVSLVGDKLLVGARMTKKFGDSCVDWAGSAYLFRWTGAQWLEEQLFVASDAAQNEAFGAGVVIGADYYAMGAIAFGGADGAVYTYSNVPNVDCNANKVTDSCDLLYAVSKDCNLNTRPDECDISLGASDDCTFDGVPDECDPDCNNNGRGDSCDISLSSSDCNQNRIPDECDLPFDCAEMDSCIVSGSQGTGPSFGDSVAIDGDWAVATSPYWVDGDGRDPSIPGSAWLFTRSGSNWVFHADITPSTPSLRFATDSAISGDRLAVVADNTYIWRRNGSNWSIEAVLPPGAVAMDGSALLLYNQVYRRSGSSWNVEATLTPNGLNVGAGDIHGNYAILQWYAHDYSPEIPDSGTAFIFRREGTNWIQEAQLFSPVPTQRGRFGMAVGIHGDYAVVGEPGPHFDECPPRQGAVHVFKRSGVSWNLMATLRSTDDEQLGFGYSVAIDGNQIIAGRRTQYEVGNFSVAVYELDSRGNYWIPKPKLDYHIPSGLGHDVALSGPWAVVGSPKVPNVVYFYAVGDDCNANGKADLCDIDAGISNDVDGNDRPDDCTPCGRFAMPDMTAGPYPESYPGCLDGTYVPKNRYLSFLPPRTPSGSSGIALRVSLTSMPGPDNCEHVPDFSAANGAQMWVGPEVFSGTMPTGIHRLQSTPYFHDWELLPDGVVNLSDCNMVPCATYTIEAITDVDYPAGPYSPGLEMYTSPVWADIVHRDGLVTPDFVVDFADISATMDRFRDWPSSPPGTWCDLVGANPTQGVYFNIDFTDIAAVVDAFRGREYPFPAPTAPMACP